MRKKTALVLWMTLWSSLLLLRIVLPPAVQATHDADHRFTVYGYIRDDNGKPISGERVIVVDKRLDQAQTTFSDGEGYYEALLHLHSTDVGDEIAVMAGYRTKTVRAEYDPDDISTERKVRVDFGKEPPEDGGTGSGINIGLVASVVVVAAVAIGLLRKKKPAQKQGGKGSKGKKKDK